MSQPKIPTRDPDIYIPSTDVEYAMSIWVEESVFLVDKEIEGIDDGPNEITSTFTDSRIELKNGTAREYIDHTMKHASVADDVDLEAVTSYLIEKELLQ